MSLQSKLFAFFIGIVVVPLTVAALLISLEVFGLLRHQDSDRVAGAAPGAAALYNERVSAVDDRVRSMSAEPALKTALVTGDPLTIESALRQGIDAKQGNLDFAMVLDSHNKLLAQVRGEPMYLPGTAAPTAEEMLVTQTEAGEPSVASLLAAYTIVPVVNGSSSASVGTLIAGDYLDNTFASELASATGIDVTMVVKGQAVASSLKNRAGVARPWTVAIPPPNTQPVRATIGNHPVDAVVLPLQNDVPATTAALMISGPLSSQARGQALLASILVFLIVAALGAAILGLALTRAIARPMRELAKGANAIAAGDYNQHIDVRSADEVGQLGRAFNEMTRRLAEHVAELQESREELKRSLARFGETLRSTHDLDKILQVVLDTSVDALRACAGTLMVVRLSPGGNELTVAASRGVDTAALRLKPGEGIAGTVAVTGEPVCVPNTRGTLGTGEGRRLPDPAPVEPPFETAIWVPVFAQGRIFAVLSLFDREDDGTFSARDLDTVLSLSDQAGVAIDNVVLHQEAQRLSITDGMTGIWNHRLPVPAPFLPAALRHRRLQVRQRHLRAPAGRQRAHRAGPPGEVRDPRHRRPGPLRGGGVRAHPARDRCRWGVPGSGEDPAPDLRSALRQGPVHPRHDVDRRGLLPEGRHRTDHPATRRRRRPLPGEGPGQEPHHRVPVDRRG